MKNKVLVLLIVMFGFECCRLGPDRYRAACGNVTDASGAVISDATVTVTNKGTARSLTVRTNATGAYVVNALPRVAITSRLKSRISRLRARILRSMFPRCRNSI